MDPSLTSTLIEDLEAENRRLRARLTAAGLDPSGGMAGDPAGRTSAALPVRDDQRFALLLESMSEGFFVVDRTGLSTMCNGAMVRLLGFGSADELIGRSIHEVIHHSHRDGTPYPVGACPIYRAARDGTSTVVDDEVFFRRDGTPMPVEYRTEPLVVDGRLEGAICTFVDITSRLDGEQQLRESEERLALAAAAGGIGIWDYEIPTRALRWDDRVRALFGLSPGRPITIEANLAALHPDDRARVERSLGSACDPSGSGSYQVQFRTVGIEDGRQRWVEARGQASFRGGAAVRLVGVVRDISKEMEAEHHLRLMVNELNHRVKNSLAMVQGVAAQTFRNTDNMEAARTSFTERLVRSQRPRCADRRQVGRSRPAACRRPHGAVPFGGRDDALRRRR